MKKILSVCFFLTTFLANAQCHLQLKCYVYDNQHQLLSSVNIVLDKQLKSSNEKGYAQFSGLCPQEVHLECSFVGFEKQSWRFYLQKDTLIQIFLEQDVQELEAIEISSNKEQHNDTQKSLISQELSKEFLTKNSSVTFVNSLEKIQGFAAINTGVGIAKPVIRGLSKNRIIVNEQGVKQQGQQWGTDHGLEIDQFAVDRVEIVKGAGSLIYGSEGIGGIINILPPAIPSKNTIGGQILGTYKSNNQLFGTSLMLQGNKNDIFFRARFSLQDFGDYAVPTQQFFYNRFILPIYNNLLKNTAGQEKNWQILWGIKRKNAVFSVLVSNFSQKVGLFSGATGIPRSYQLYDDGSRNIALPRQVNEHLKVLLKSTILFKEDFLEIDAGYQFNDRQEESNPHAHGRLFLDSLNTVALQLGLQTWTLNAHFHQHFSPKNKIIYGFNFEKQQNKIKGYEFLIPNYTQTSYGIFALQEYNFDKKISLNLGLRYDWATQNSDKYVDAFYEQRTGKAERIGDLKRNYQNFSGALGLSWQINSQISTKINIGKSFRFPNISELTSNGIHHGTFRHELGNPNLDIEQAYQFDGGFYWKSANFDINVTPYFNYFTNYLYLRPNAQFSPLPEGGQMYEYSQSKAITSGLESSIAWTIANFEIQTGFEYLYNLNVDTSLPLPFSPPFSASLELTYNLPKIVFFQDKFYVNYYIKHTAAQNQVDRNEKQTAGYTLMNIGLGTNFRFGKQKIHLITEIRNVTDKNYMNHLSRYRLLNIPEQGINYVFTLLLPFGS